MLQNVIRKLPIRGVRGIMTTSYTQSGKGETVSSKEMEQFQKFVGEWWRPGGPYDSLRSMNELRVPLIQDVCQKQIGDGGAIEVSRPLKNINILDVGCGGGILAEPLSRLGGAVTGIDPLEENVKAAQKHADQDPWITSLTYQCTDIETISSNYPNHFDVVVASEVLEHVNNPLVFVEACCNAVKPGGHIVLTTINRTLLSTALVKYMAEYVLRIVPENTHDENKFVTPYEVTDMLRKGGMVEINFQGMMLNPLSNKWSWTAMDQMNYACTARKPTQ